MEEILIKCGKYECFQRFPQNTKKNMIRMYKRRRFTSYDDKKKYVIELFKQELMKIVNECNRKIQWIHEIQVNALSDSLNNLKI